ncbi:hypothetical protein PYCCODRAFT_1442534 [Trametes coccinea BRFM310]|uniref:DUF6570 domain-containing protein n=1 Tax=Trametes coccinea (strain BRFM310) TaxID=1353009 RepID=A0A1Y2IYY4_TRAC3|nr:hypothetical protein PYCCODRAFT_1442534 [Trametes coccinea BRFM310]
MTFIEEQIIARCCAKACIVYLRPDGEDDDAPVLVSNQRGLKGHVIVHPQRPEKLVSVLPPSLGDILTPIYVIFRILDVLRWLNSHNPLLHHLVLPQNDLLPHDVHTKATMARYDVDHTPSDDVPTNRNISSDPVKFRKVVITDVDGRASSNELRAAAIRHIKNKGGGYLEIPHQPKPVNEFCNPDLFTMIYPTLFPYGVGGCEDRGCTRPLSLR